MTSKYALIAAAAMTVAGIGLNTTTWADDAGDKIERAADKTGSALKDGAERTGDTLNRTADNTRDSLNNLRNDGELNRSGALPPGVEKAKTDDSEDIRDMLSHVTEAAVTNGGFDDIVERFVDADRDRLNKFANENQEKFATLNGRVDQIRKDWKAKYGKDLDLDQKMVFGNSFQGFTVAQGEIVNPALLSNWPVQNDKARSGSSGDRLEKSTTIERTTTGDNTADSGGTVRVGDTKVSGNVEVKSDAIADARDKVHDITGGDRNLNKGRGVAVVTFPANQGMPELMVSLIHELPDNWKIDVPDDVDGQKLHDQLLNHLTMFGEMKDQWPADVNQASRMLSHHVMAAVYDVSAKPAQK